MKMIGVIPARWASTRFEGKVLALISGRPMIQHVWERAKQSSLLNDVVIACDDARVKKAAEKFGARVVMTSPEHESGSDRIAEAVSSVETDIVVNIQGDEPLIEPTVIDELAMALSDSSDDVMATVIKRVTDKGEYIDPNVVKAVIDQNGYALYFSRSTIPYNRDQGDVCYYKHLGLYAYRKDFLLKFTQMPKSQLEVAERLEQLRVLEAGYKIKTIITELDSIGVDTAEDLAKVEALLK